MVAGNYLARHFTSIQQALEQGEWDNAYRPPGPENLADGLTKIKSVLVRPLSLSKAASFAPSREWQFLNPLVREEGAFLLSLPCHLPLFFLVHTCALVVL